MEYTKWNKRNLTERRYRYKQQTTSVWCTTTSTDKPLLVLVHGISGDHAGMVPLAMELEATHRLAIVELPGHGKSGMIPYPSADKFQQWFCAVLGEIENDIGPVSGIIAHSFGCSVVLDPAVVTSKPITLLAPVPTPSKMYARYSRVVVRSAHFLAHIYNWPPFIVMRSMALSKLRDKSARQRVRWVGWRSRSNARQVVYQAKLVDAMILDETVYARVPKDVISLVVCGMADTTAEQQDTLEMEAVFGRTRTVFLNGGHLLPIESPARVAAVIREYMVY